jgi:glycosyltransferase involved in cell wall biosynthesis
MSRKWNDLLFIGPKAPPVTGYANIVNSLNSCLNKKRINTTYFSTVPSLFSKLFPSRKWKVLRFLYLLVIIPFIVFLIPLHKCIYININGGAGLFFDIVITCFSRLMRKQIYLHHNSYSYLNRNHFIARHLFKIASIHSTHVVNSLSMKDCLIKQYKGVSIVKVISNAAILTIDNPDYFSSSLPSLEQKTQDKMTFGFMGYMDDQKGIDLFCETISYLISKGISLTAIAVGPVHNKLFFNNIKDKFSSIVEFKEPVYGSDFDLFFQEVDILLFPSKYKNEAEPLTVYHALNAGVPVLSTQVGCLKNMMDECKYCDSFSELTYKEHVLRYIENNIAINMNRQTLREAVSLNYQNTNDKKINQFDHFISSIKLELTK